MVGVINYGAGNIRSVERALSFLGIPYLTSDEPERLAKADRLILPGVGEASFAMKRLNDSKLSDFIKRFCDSGKTRLGRLLGRADYARLLIRGRNRLPGLNRRRDAAPARYSAFARIKNTAHGMEQRRNAYTASAFFNIPEGADFYFVHSYYMAPQNPAHAAGIVNYGGDVACVLIKDNIFAAQFHPEKSGAHGLQLLRNFNAL